MFRKKNLDKKIKYFTLTGMILVCICIAILYSPLLNIGHVQVNGNTSISREEVLHIANLGEPLNIFYVDTKDVERILEDDLRIDSADVQRKGLSILQINIKERKPVAIVATHYGYIAVNYEGLVLGADKEFPKLHLPLIKGIEAEDVYIGDKIKFDNLQKVLIFLQWLNPVDREHIKEVDFTHEDMVVLITDQDAKIILGDLRDPTKIAAECNEFFKEIAKSEVPLDYANFSYTRPVLKFR